MSSLPDRFKSLRQERGLSQHELSQELNIPRTTLSSWELGTRGPDIYTLQILADFFNVSTDYLLGRIDVRNPVKTDKLTNDIYNLINDDPSIEEFIKKLTYSNELKLITKQLIDLPKESIIRLIRVIKALEEDSSTI
jgi:transcriptional regulator with XRE-family HTH domain